MKNAGPATGEVYRAFDQLLDEYYAALGYDRRGIPTPARLQELGLARAAQELSGFIRK